jgi:hypothetical protein
LEAVPEALQKYRQWIESHIAESWLPSDDNSYQMIESWQCYTINSEFDLAQEGYEVNAWFRHDWKPLSEQDIANGLKLLSWSRVDLLAAIGGLSQEELNADHPGERGGLHRGP